MAPVSAEVRPVFGNWLFTPAKSPLTVGNAAAHGEVLLCVEVV
jgi:hypothetical protein